MLHSVYGVGRYAELINQSVLRDAFPVECIIKRLIRNHIGIPLHIFSYLIMPNSLTMPNILSII